MLILAGVVIIIFMLGLILNFLSSIWDKYKFEGKFPDSK